MKRLVISKYGSATLLGDIEGSFVDYDVINKHGGIINKLNDPVILVTSGAVAFGNVITGGKIHYNNEVTNKRALSAIGNPLLSAAWQSAIKDKIIAQALLTHRDLKDKKSQRYILDVLEIFLADNSRVVLQVNDNDMVTDEELKNLRGDIFGDNDEITALITSICAPYFDEIVVCVNTMSNGVLDFEGKVMQYLPCSDITEDFLNTFTRAKTFHGTGGIKRKLRIFKQLVSQQKNVTVYIINGKDPCQLEYVLLGKQGVGTCIYND